VFLIRERVKYHARLSLFYLIESTTVRSRFSIRERAVVEKYEKNKFVFAEGNA